jgi:GTP cyclohydrolase IA
VIERSKMEAGIRMFLDGLGQSFPGDDLAATPARVARAWAEDLLSGYAVDPLAVLTHAPADGAQGTVVVRGIRFASMCVHHLLPFFGDAAVAYLPDRRLAGLSKLGRVVEAHARRLQTQERLTSAILGTLVCGLEPRAAIVQLAAQHTCMSIRGVRQDQGRMVTLAAAGAWDRDPQARAEILQLLR